MSEHENEAEVEAEVVAEAEIISLTQRVEIIEERLGIDPHAVVADKAASAVAGADAAPLSEPPAEPAEPVEPAVETAEPEVTQS